MVALRPSIKMSCKSQDAAPRALSFRDDIRMGPSDVSIREIWDDTPEGAQVTTRMLDAIARI